MFRSGQIIGQYILIKQLGQGAFGDVWLAEKQTSPSIQVAIKLPRGEQIDWKSITQEIGLWIICGQHPNVLPFIEAKIFEGQIAIISEYATGGSLEDLIKESGSLSIDEAIEITIGILNGLAHLHSNGIIHRDLKPANILLQNKTPRLADFGISRVMSTNHSSQTVSGTPYYMAPEAFDGKRNALTDIWAVGVILYQLLTGNLPYPYHEYTRLIGAIVLRQPDPLPTSIPQKLNEIVLKSLAKAPEERFQTAQDMRLQLEAFRKYFYQQSMLATIGNFEEKENAEGRKPKQTLLIPYRRGAKWGYCDLQKNLLIPAHYDRTEFFYEGLAEIGLSGKWGFIDPDGQKVITPKYQSVRRFSKGLAAIKVAAESEDLISKSLWGFINQKEEQVIPPEYDYVESFRGRRAVVSVKHLWGFINRAGVLTIPMRFLEARDFHGGLAAVRTENGWGYIDELGEMQIMFHYDEALNFSDGIAAVRQRAQPKKWGLINKTGTHLTPFEFDLADVFSEGLMRVRQNNKFSYINRDGKIEFSVKYDLAGTFKDGLARVRSNGKYGFINRDLQIAIPLKYEDAMNFSNNFALVKFNRKWGYIGRDGTEYFED